MLRRTTQARQRDATIVVRLRVVAVERNGLIEYGKRFAVASGVDQRKAQVIARRRIARRQADHALGARDRERQIAARQRDRAGVDECGRIVGIGGEHLRVERFGLGKPPRLLQSEGTAEQNSWSAVSAAIVGKTSQP
jgi:hypothetical protein